MVLRYFSYFGCRYSLCTLKTDPKYNRSQNKTIDLKNILFIGSQPSFVFKINLLNCLPLPSPSFTSLKRNPFYKIANNSE